MSLDQPADATTKDALARFAAYLERAGVSGHTVRAYQRWTQEFAAFLEPSGRTLQTTLAEQHERTFAARDFRQYLKHTRHLAPASVNQALAALHTFCQFRGYATPQVQREDLPHLAPRALSADEQRRLLRAVERLERARDRAIAYTLYYSGLRIAECAALDMEDVIASDRRGKLVVRKGKGDRQREVPLHTVARQALLACKQARQAQWGQTLCPAFFLNYQGQRLSARSIDKLMDRLAEDAHIELTAHILRHTFATNLIRQGNDLVLVAEITGHARLETVRRYSLPTEADLQAAIEGLPRER
jgi:integrase/recombinase XerC